MRGEFSTCKGPKFAAINSNVSHFTDFVFLTETKVYPTDVHKRKLKYGLIPTLHTSQQGPRGGVIVFSHPKHELLEGSFRESEQLGHYVCGVYNVHGSNTIIAGVYGRSDNVDISCASIIQELNTTLTQLTQIFHTNRILLAGDFNAGRFNTDFSSKTITKIRTSECLNALITDHALIDLAERTGKLQHTWHRRGPAAQTSRIDLVLTNIPNENVQYSTSHTIFDHVLLQARIGISPVCQHRNMKDFILGSDEFIITATDHIQQKLIGLGLWEQLDQLPRNDNNDSGDDEQMTPEDDDENTNNNDRLGLQTVPSEDAIEALNTKLATRDTTALQQFNIIIQNLQEMHNKIHVQQMQQNRKKLKDVNKSLMQLQNAKAKANTEESRIAINTSISDAQRKLANELEAKDKAAQLRINNFYKTNTGKMVPVTFNCIKEKRGSRDIHNLILDNDITLTDNEAITTEMQNWYQNTANKAQDQTLSLDDFLNQSNILLPQLSDIEKQNLDKPFTSEEIKYALQIANEKSASGPTGQSISFYKLLFMEIPDLMTAAINQMAYVPDLMDLPELHWIRTRKIVYIPKKQPALTPSDYRPLSMLEVLYKIPSRIMSKRLTEILPSIIGKHQYGFMSGRSIQEPIMLASHLVQDAQENNKPLQLISYDLEKAFDRTSHKIIEDSLRKFGIPEIMIQSIRRLALYGWAEVEVNGKLSTRFLIKTGSGQGDPISSILFLICTEPLNRAIVQLSQPVIYKTIGNLAFGSLFFADDNLAGLNIESLHDLEIIQKVYNDYTKVSGLNINLRKSSALCINTPPDILQIIRDTGIQTPDTIRYLGVQLGINMEETIKATIAHINPKAIKRRIMATTPPTDLLHRATLINRALIPIYNHVFMSLPITNQITTDLCTDITSFLWTKQREGQTVAKRRLVAKNRISASFGMGGLQIPDPQTTVEGLQINLLQKLFKKELYNDDNHLLQLTKSILLDAGHPSINDHLNLGPKEWEKTSRLIRNKNLVLSQAFQSCATLQKMQETDKETWGTSPIYGHSKESVLFPFTPADKIILLEKGLITVSQIFETGQNGMLTRAPRAELIGMLTNFPRLQLKLSLLHKTVKQVNFSEQWPSINTNIHMIFSSYKNASVIHKKIAAAAADKNIKAPPALATRIKDGKDYVLLPDFINAYRLIKNPLLCSKTKENSFQTLNRTIWTNNKAFKSGMRDDPDCPYCGETETMEHLYFGCENYSELQWTDLGRYITSYIQDKFDPTCPELRITYRSIVFNQEITNIHRKLPSKTARKFVQILIHEVRRDIYFRKVNHTPNNNAIVLQIRRKAHLISVIDKLHSYFSYLGATKWAQAIQCADILKQLIIDDL